MTHKTGFAYHPNYLEHDTGPNHPERPDRLRASLAALHESEVWEQLHSIEPTPASIAQLCYAHEQTYPEHIQQYCEAEMPLTYDTTVVKASFDIAKLSTGGVLRIADAVVTGAVKNGFAMVRPLDITRHRTEAWGFVCSTISQLRLVIFNANTGLERSRL